MPQAKRIIGLSCGRRHGNSEILLKEALMAAEEYGIESEIIRAMDLRVRPCTGCEACSLTLSRGGEARCVIKDDDVPWILDKILVEDAALIISAPVYHLRANAYFEAIHERMLPTMFRNPRITEKTRVGAIISVGGGEPEWTPLGLTSMNILMQHTRKLVDQMQVNFCGRPGSVLARDEYLGRARRLGENVARAILMPIEDVGYMGEDSAVSCPVCHCNVVSVPDKLPEVYCPVCWVKGTIHTEGGRMGVRWETGTPRFSTEFIGQHLDLIARLAKKFYAEQQPVVKERIKKYNAYGKVVKP